jgi:RNA polymerase sigma-70 factor (ECF subfamily)
LTSSDAELVQRCIQGDQQAWADVVRLFSRRIYNLAYRFTSSHAAAEDLTQEVFIRVYRSLQQYDSGLGDLSNWLMRLARNLIIDDYRKRQRTPTDSGDELTYQEIVDLLKIPEGTVKSRINRGRIELAKVLRRMKVNPD